MARKNAASDIPKMHTIRKSVAAEIYHVLYTGKDNTFKKEKISEIETWLAQGDFFVDLNPLELAKEWQEYSQE